MVLLRHGLGWSAGIVADCLHVRLAPRISLVDAVGLERAMRAEIHLDRGTRLLVDARALDDRELPVLVGWHVARVGRAMTRWPFERAAFVFGEGANGLFIAGAASTLPWAPMTLAFDDVAAAAAWCFGATVADPVTAMPAEDWQFLGEVRAALTDADDVTRALDTLGLSRRTLQRRLARLGLGATELVRQQRIERAVRQVWTGAKIENIARVHGFSSPASFFANCRRYTGYTPAALRELAAESPDALSPSGGPWRHVEAAEFAADPTRAVVVRETFAVWSLGPRGAGIVIFTHLSPSASAEMFTVLDTWMDDAQTGAVLIIDFSQAPALVVDAAGATASFGGARRLIPRTVALGMRTGVVVPEGPIASIVRGYTIATGSRNPQVVDESLDAVLTFFAFSPDDQRDVCALRARLMTERETLSGLLSDLRALLTRQPELSLIAAASALGLSERTLQRRLGELGTNIREERAKATQSRP